MNFIGVNPNIVFSQEMINRSLSNFSILFLRIFNKLLAYDFNEQYYFRLLGKSKINEYIRWRIGYLIKKIEEKSYKYFITHQKKFINESDSIYIKKYFLESNKRLLKIFKKDIYNLGY
jgi:hypothetical protein